MISINTAHQTNSQHLHWDKIPVSASARKLLAETNVFGQKFQLSYQQVPNPDFRASWEELHLRWRNLQKDKVRTNPIISAYCDFYKSIGLNPKDTPPSVLNIIQRFLIKDTLEKFPIINPIVDAVNVAAVETLIPLGVFDASCVNGALILDIATGNESYVPLGMKETLKLAPGVVVLRDRVKVLSQFCYRDSEAQKVTPHTKEIWLLGCQVPTISENAVTDSLGRAHALLSCNYILTPLPH